MCTLLRSANKPLSYQLCARDQFGDLTTHVKHWLARSGTVASLAGNDVHLSQQQAEKVCYLTRNVLLPGDIKVF